MSTAIRRSYARVPAYGHRRGLNRGARHGNMGGWRVCSNGRSCWPRSPRRQHVVAGSSSSAARQASGRPRSCARSSRSRRRGCCRDRARTSRRRTPLGPFADVAARTEGALAELLAAGADARRVARALLDELARPAVVVLEDVHWADEATLDALRRARQADRRDARARGRDVPGRRGRERPSAARGARRARLRTRCRAADRATALARRRPQLAGPHGADGDAVYALTGGNAFFVTEVLAVGSAPLPETVRDAVLARDRSLGRGERGACSTSPRSFPARRSSRCSRRWRRTSSTSSTAALPPASSVRTGTRSRSATSWRGSRWKTPSRQDGVDGSTPRFSRVSRPRRRLGAGPRAPRPPCRASGGRRGRARVRARGRPSGRRRGVAPGGGAAVRARAAVRRRARRPRAGGPPRPLRARGAADRAVSRGGRCVAGGDRAPSRGRRPACRGPQPRVADEGLHPDRAQRRGGGGEPGRRSRCSSRSSRDPSSRARMPLRRTSAC